MLNTNTTEQSIEAVAAQEGVAEADAPKRTRNKKVAASPDATPSPRKDTKADVILKRLRSAKGATIAQLIEATGWQAHSVRGYLSGTVKKKLGLELTSEPGKDNVRRYRVAEGGADAGTETSAEAATPAAV